MAKLYFKYGAMGSSKTAQALMCRFNYIDKGFSVLFAKPVIDTRDNNGEKAFARSRIGLFCECETFSKDDNLFDFVQKKGFLKEKCVVIVDECQFCSKNQINQLHDVSEQVPVLCYGLLVNFKTELFEGSKRLVEIADSLMEIKSVCKCGKKASVNARFINGELMTEGEEIVIGDTEYEGLCYSCYRKLLNDKQ